jgi:hypothetical protein
MKDRQELSNLLANYTGSETWWRHPFGRGCTYTDGAKAFAENAGNGAYWFLDIVFTEYVELMREQGFITVTLCVHDNGKAVVKVTDGNQTTLEFKHIDWTDCPKGDWKFFFVDDVLLIPSEY